MKINRDTLNEKLFQFSQAGHGVVIGKPGIGKTYALNALKEYLNSKNIISFIIKIDNTENADDETIGNEIGFTKNEVWYEILKKIRVKEGNRAVLIFDGYDAARNEEIRRSYLKQIKKAKIELSESWNVVVSVRTYDATKSPELIQIFPNTSINGSQFEIKALEEEELKKVFNENNSIRLFYQEVTPELQIILRTPYFLILLESILLNASADEINSIKLIKSETQLLNALWTKKINNKPNHIQLEKVLLNITNHLIETRSLNCSKSSFLESLDSSELTTFETLLSEDILNVISFNKSRISYAHNILFDYAVSRLMITPQLNELLVFINCDFSRPFFLRPSFIYFFTQMWYESKSDFWKIYWGLVKQSQKEIQLFIKLIMNNVIVSEYDKIDDLNPILNNPDKSLSDAIIQQLLQSVRFVKNKLLSDNDLNLLYVLSGRLVLRFLWDFSFLLEKAIDGTIIKGEIFEKCGIAARKFFDFALHEGSYNPLVNRLASSRGIKMLAKTYDSNIADSKELLRRVLDFLKQEDFEIWYFSSLCEDLNFIIPYDADFVSEIYFKIFNHKELSNAETSMATITFNMKSNRRQDFDLCYYRLVTLFPEFIKTAPEKAIETGLAIVNKYVLDEKLNYFENAKKESFKIGNIECEFIPDASSMWRENLVYHQPVELAEKIIEYFEKLINEDKLEDLKKLLTLYYQNAKVAFTWKILLEFGVKFSEQLKKELFYLCNNPLLMSCSDTIFEVGKIINQTYQNWTDEEKKEIESSILIMASDDKESKRHFDRKISRLLNQIPYDLIQLEKSKIFLKEHDDVKNEPTFQSTFSSEPYTPEMWLGDKGINIEKTQNAQLLELSKTFKRFNNQWAQAAPSKEIYSVCLVDLKAIFSLLKVEKFEADNDVKYIALKDIAETSVIISRDTLEIEEGVFRLVSEIIIYCFTFISEYDKNFDEESSPARGYSSTARIEAAEGFVNLAIIDKENIFISYLEKAANDSNVIVRFYAVKHLIAILEKYPSQFESIIQTRLEKETDIFTASILINNVPIDKEFESLTNRTIEIANKREELLSMHNAYTEHYSELLLFLFVRNGNKLSESILISHLSNATFSRAILFTIFKKFIDPADYYNNYAANNDLNKPLFNLINTILQRVESVLQLISEEDLKIENARVKESLETIDFIIQRFYFALDLNNTIRRRGKMPVTDENRKAFYFLIKPLLEYVIKICSEIKGGGIIAAHTAHYFIQTLNGVVTFDPKNVLSMAATVTKYSVSTGYTFDSSAVREIVQLTEKILADHRDLLLQSDSFNELVELLDIYINSGWTDALELLWKLDDVFR